MVGNFRHRLARSICYFTTVRFMLIHGLLYVLYASVAVIFVAIASGNDLANASLQQFDIQ